MSDARCCYRLFGLYVSSDLPLPEADPFAEGMPCDVTVRRGLVPPDGATVGPKTGPLSHAAANALWLSVPGVARYLVSNGSEIAYQPEDGVDEDSVRVFMLGPCFGALLAQRGLLVLHGNAFEVADGCVVCVGESGAGKSTLAARMMQRGHRVIADDVCPVDALAHAIPGIARLKLWQDALQRLEIETAGLPRVRPSMAKFGLQLTKAFVAEPSAVRAIYVLSPWNRDGFEAVPATGIAKFQALRLNSYRLPLVTGMGLGQQHLQQCGALASRVPVVKILRPRRGFDLDGLSEVILGDLASRGAAG